MLGLVAVEAVRLALDRDVLVSGQRAVALVAAEVLDVPRLALRAGVLRGEDELVAGVAPRDAGVRRVVAGAEHPAGVVVVQQVHEDLLKKRREDEGHSKFSPGFKKDFFFWGGGVFFRPNHLKSW